MARTMYEQSIIIAGPSCAKPINIHCIIMAEYMLSKKATIVFVCALSMQEIILLSDHISICRLVALKWVLLCLQATAGLHNNLHRSAMYCNVKLKAERSCKAQQIAATFFAETKKKSSVNASKYANDFWQCSMLLPKHKHY